MYSKKACVNIADPDKTAPEVWSGSTLFAIPLSMYKKQNFDRKKVFEILGYLP